MAIIRRKLRLNCGQLLLHCSQFGKFPPGKRPGGGFFLRLTMLDLPTVAGLGNLARDPARVSDNLAFPDDGEGEGGVGTLPPASFR